MIRLVKIYFTVDQLASWSLYWKIKRFGQHQVTGLTTKTNSLKGKGFWGIKSLAIPGKIQKSVKKLFIFRNILKLGNLNETQQIESIKTVLHGRESEV